MGAEHSHPQSPSKGDSKEWLHLIPGNKRHIFLGPISSVNQIHLCHRIILGPQLGHLLLKWLLLFFIMPQYLPMSIGPMCLWQSYLSLPLRTSRLITQSLPLMCKCHQLIDFKPQVLYQLWTFSFLLLLTVWVLWLSKIISPTSFTFESLSWKYYLN